MIKNEGQPPDIRFKVQWLDGERNWVRMKDLRIQAPLLVLRYGLRHGMTLKPGWEWVENFVNSDKELTRIINAYKVSKATSYKFGNQVPKSTKDALRLDSQAEENFGMKQLKQSSSRLMITRLSGF